MSCFLWEGFPVYFDYVCLYSVCVCVYVCARAHKCMRVCVWCVCACAYMCVCACAHMYMCLYVCVRVGMHLCIITARKQFLWARLICSSGEEMEMVRLSG